MSLPEGWVEAPLAELASKIGSGATPRGGREAYAQAGTPLIRSMNVHFRGFEPDGLAFIDNAQADVLANVKVSANDVLLNITGASIGRVCLAPAEMAGARVNQHVCIIRAEGVLPRFVQRFLASPDMQRFILQENYGLTRQALTKVMIEEIGVPLPPAAEQCRIVAKLDALTARLARARTELDRVPVLAERLREEVLERAASGALLGLPDIQNRRCEDWIESTFYGPRFSKDDYVAEGIPTARTTDFNSDGTMSIDDAPKVACSDEDYGRWGCFDGDLLVTRTGSIGKCAIYMESLGKVLPSAYLIRVRFDGRLNPRFAWMMFASPVGQKHLGVNSRAVTQPNINASAIRSLPIPDLTIDQQVETVTIVDRAFARADRMEAEATRARALIDRLEAAILGRAFRGELVPQDPNDEPASVLLDRIRAQRAAAPKPKRGRRKKERA